MAKLIVEGGNKIKGQVDVQGSKNSALPMLSATLLTGDESVLHCCPQISDIDAAIRILRYLGCDAKMHNHTVVVDSSGMNRYDIPENLMRKMRSSVVFLGAIIARTGRAELYFPGGCELGPRPIDLHLDSLRKMGVSIDERFGCISCKVKDTLHGAKIVLPFPSVGATENIILAAVLAKGTTVIANAAREPEIIEKFTQCNGRYSYEKDIPNYCYNFSKRQFDILLESLLCGDGTKSKKGHYVYYTYSGKMAKSLHTLLILNGYNAQLYGFDKEYNYDHPSNFKRKDGIVFNSYQVFISNKKKDIFSVINKHFADDKKGTGWKISKVNNKKIVCFETEYGTLITRNGSKMAFHGNSKNMAHSFRLVNMGIEIARGEGVKVDRTNIDRDFLLAIRNHQYEYD